MLMVVLCGVVEGLLVCELWVLVYGVVDGDCLCV